MTNENGRSCACGCGSKVIGRQRFLNDAHRKRAARRRLQLVANPDRPDAIPDANADISDIIADVSDAKPDIPDDLPGAVEELLADFPNTSAPLAASLRLLAGELARSPGRPGLWSRFLGIVEGILDEARREPDAEVGAMLWPLRVACNDPDAHAPAPGARPLVHCDRCCTAPGFFGRG
jgi:hypothetical protein